MPLIESQRLPSSEVAKAPVEMAEAPRSRLIPSLLLRIGEAGDFPSNHGFKSMPSLPAKRSRLDLKGVRLVNW